MTALRRIGLALGLAGAALLALPFIAHTQSSSPDLQQLVAPVALYPDGLLADVLAAATFPSDVDAAAQWLQQNASLSSDQVADAVDRQPWDDSVKSLTEFPSVLAMMDQNLSWTSALGDAYYNEPDDVMDAVQALRGRAMSAGTLQSNSQITVTTADGIISIEPAGADDVYVPSYDAWDVYGPAIEAWPDFVFAPGIVTGPRVSWGLHIHIGGDWVRQRWGSRNWNFDWRQHRVMFDRQPFVSHSPSVIDRHLPPRVAPAEPRGRADVRPGARPTPPPPNPAPGRGRAEVKPEPRGASGTGALPPKPATPAPPAPTARGARGFPEPHPTAPPSGTHSGAMSGINHGGTASQNSQRGQSSMGARPSAPPSHPSGPPAAPRTPPSQPPANPGRGRGGRQ